LRIRCGNSAVAAVALAAAMVGCRGAPPPDGEYDPNPAPSAEAPAPAVDTVASAAAGAGEPGTSGGAEPPRTLPPMPCGLPAGASAPRDGTPPLPGRGTTEPCGPPRGGDPVPVAPPGRDTSTVEVTVIFSRGESAAPVIRRLPDGRAVLRGTIEQLLEGPGARERAEGIDSWFSERTAGMLRGVTIDGNGRAIVDFSDFSSIIPNASTSAGSAMLLRELNSTIFQFDNVRSIEYRFNGSCERFFSWIQRDCAPIRRQE
jgi:hypothetical protein